MRLTVLFLALVPFAAACGGTNERTWRIPSAAMEPTLVCAKPGIGCTGIADDHVVSRPDSNPKRGDIVVFSTPPKAALECGAGGTFVKRIVGLPGETIHEDGKGFIYADGAKLSEPYVTPQHRLEDTENFGRTWHVPQGDYFVVGDNRAESCDSRVWGSVPRRNIIGVVVKVIRTTKDGVHTYSLS